jgi:hypothetical protein
MEHKQFGHLQVQDLFQKGYYTNVYRAFDPSKDKGVLLQIITPIFSANNRYNNLLTKFTKGLKDLTNGSFLSITQHINYADRIGLVYDLPHGSAEEWETFTYSDFTASPDLVNNSQQTLHLAFSDLLKHEILHRAFRPDALVFHSESNQVYFSFFGMLENLFYIETNQNPAYKGQFQAHFYTSETLNNFNHYDASDEFFSFSKSWYFLEMLKNVQGSKNIALNLKTLSIPDSIKHASCLNMLMNGSLHERQNAFKEQFQLSKPVILESESQSKPELIQEVKDNIGIAQAQKEDAILFTLPTTKPNKEEILIPPLTNKKGKHKYTLVSVAAVLVLCLILAIYFKSSKNKETISNPQLTAKVTKEKIEQKQSDSIVQEKNIKNTQYNAKEVDDKIITTELDNTISPFSILDNSSGISQLDNLSSLIDQYKKLSKNNQALLNKKTNEIYANLPQMIEGLKESDQRKLCNYRSKFENYLRRNGSKVNESIAKNLDVHCN